MARLLTVACGLAIAGLLTSGAAAAGPIEDLAPGMWFEAPNTRMSTVFPSPAPPGTDGPDCVVSCWGGAAYDSTRDRLLVWGGGHGNYSGNEIYAFDVNTLQWQRLTNPSTNVGGSESSAVYPDGNPRSVHSYGNLEYAPNVDRFFSVGMAGLYPGGSESRKSFAYDFATARWVASAAIPAEGFTTGGIPVYDPQTGHIFYHGSGTSNLKRYDPGADTWTEYNPAEYLEIYSTAAIDPTRRLLVTIGGYAGSAQFMVWNLNSPNNAPTSPARTGPRGVESADAPGFTFDRVSNKFVAWDGGTNVFTLDPANWTWTQVNAAAGNTVNPGAPQGTGTYGRWRYIASKNAFILLQSGTRNVFFYKLSSGTGAQPPTVALSANPTSVPSQGTSTLTWTTNNATSCTASGGWSGTKPTSGTEVTAALTATTTFTLNCSNANGSAGSSATVTVASQTPAPTVTFSANPAAVALNGSTSLTWTSSNATSCQGSGGLSGWAGAKATQGSQSVGPFAAATTFNLSCTGAGGTTPRSATVSILPVPTLAFSANPTAVNAGNRSTLTWSSTNATGCAASGAWAGNKATSGSEQSAVLNATSIFGLDCMGAGGSTQRSVTVTVNGSPPPPPPPAPTVSLSANPTAVNVNGSSTLTWSSTNATSCTASGAWAGSKATSGNEPTGALSTTQSYTLTCTGAGGSANAAATVTVNAGGGGGGGGSDDDSGGGSLGWLSLAALAMLQLARRRRGVAL